MKHTEDKLKDNKGKEIIFCKKCGDKKPDSGWKEKCK
jgi:hypothetical protein